MPGYKLNTTIITLIEVSIENVEDCSGDINAWELQEVKVVIMAHAPLLHHMFKKTYGSKTAAIEKVEQET